MNGSDKAHKTLNKMNDSLRLHEGDSMKYYSEYSEDFDPKVLERYSSDKAFDYSKDEDFNSDLLEMKEEKSNGFLKKWKTSANNWWKKTWVWRGLEVEEWDVHTIATDLTGSANGESVTINRAATLLEDGGYRINKDSTWSCLQGKWKGFFDSFNAPVFITTIAIVLAFIIVFACLPELTKDAFPPVRDWISTYLGWFYILVVDFVLIFLVFLCFTRYGDIRLGDDNSVPEYSFGSWCTMLFSAGMGIGLVFYGVAEPILTYQSPPHYNYGTSDALAYERSIPLTLFNWGIHSWGPYSVLGLAICYFNSRLKLPLSIRSALYPLFGSWTMRWPGHIIDIIATLGTIFGLATSLGIGTLQLNAGLNFLNKGIPINFWTQLIIICVTTCLAMISVLSGTSKGIKWLSNTNTLLSVILWFSIFCINRPAPSECPVSGEVPCYPVEPKGSTLEYFDGIVQNFGLYWTIILERLFRTGAASSTEKAWMSSWTIYYFGWFISWSPFVSTFLAEVSRGRTIKQYVVGTLIVPLIVTVLWFTVFGQFGMNTQMAWTNPEIWPDSNEGASLEDWNDLSKQPIEVMLFVIYKWHMHINLISEPTFYFLSVLTLIVLVIFFVSSSDSGCLVVTIVASGGRRDPPKWQKVVWVWLCALIAIVLMISGGDAALSSLQALVVTLGLPLSIIILLIIAGLFKTLQLDPYIVHAPKPIYPDENFLKTFKYELKREKSFKTDLKNRRKANPKPKILHRDGFTSTYTEDHQDIILSIEQMPCSSISSSDSTTTMGSSQRRKVLPYDEE